MKKFIVKKRIKKDYEQFTCRIECSLLMKIRKIVDDNGLESINSFINNCLIFAIDNVEFEDDNSELH